MHLHIHTEVFALKQAFRIARGARSDARVVRVLLTRNGASGQGECVPYPRYGESPESVVETLEGARRAIAAGLDRDGLQRLLPPGAARNALDLALWDLEAAETGLPVWRRAGLPEPAAALSAYTIVLDSPDLMAAAARAAADKPLLKIKIGGAGDLDRVRAVAAARPDARLIVDANEGLDPAALEGLLAQARGLRVEVVEQPFAAGAEGALGRIASPVALCADETFHTADDIERVLPLYDAVNIKLDKAGGLTAALAAARAARAAGLRIMVGCMVGTSLGAAPAALLSSLADWTDLDGPLLLAKDREPGLEYRGAWLQPAPSGLWGDGGRGDQGDAA